MLSIKYSDGRRVEVAFLQGRACFSCEDTPVDPDPGTYPLTDTQVRSVGIALSYGQLTVSKTPSGDVKTAITWW